MGIKQVLGALVGLGGVFALAVGAQAQPVCSYAVEVNAVRGGSPAVKGGVKSITAKARIANGTAPGGTTQTGTTFTIDAICISGACTPGANLGSASGGPVTLLVGRGGRGGKIDVPTACGPGDRVNYVATFTGLDGTGNGATCTGVGSSRNKTCQ